MYKQRTPQHPDAGARWTTGLILAVVALTAVWSYSGNLTVALVAGGIGAFIGMLRWR